MVTPEIPGSDGRRDFLFGETMNNQLYYKIRPATLDDVEAIRRMQARSWRETYLSDEAGVTEGWLRKETENWLTPEKLEQSREHLGVCFADPTHFYRVAFLEGRVVGLLHLDTKEDGSKHLWGLYTDKTTHGTGLAQKLWALASDWIGDNDCDLEVVSYNERAKAFYRKCGFEDGQKIEELFKDKIPTMTMTRKGRRQ